MKFDFNEWNGAGRLTKDVQLNYSKSGDPVATMYFATNKSWTTESGEKKEKAMFVKVVVWGKQAEACSKYLKKGSAVFIEGELENNDWEDTDGKKIYSFQIHAKRVHFLGDPAHKEGNKKEEVGEEPEKADEPKGLNEDNPF